MKIKAYLDKDELELEVYKVQVALFGEPAVLIYNEDRTEQYEETNPKQIKAIRSLIGKSTMKCFVAGHTNPEGKIVLMKVLPKDIAKDIKW